MQNDMNIIFIFHQTHFRVKKRVNRVKKYLCLNYTSDYQDIFFYYYLLHRNNSI